MTTTARIWLAIITILAVSAIVVFYGENKARINDVKEARLSYFVAECRDINSRNERSMAAIDRLEEQDKLSEGGVIVTRFLITTVLPVQDDCMAYARKQVSPPPVDTDE